MAHNRGQPVQEWPQLAQGCTSLVGDCYGLVDTSFSFI